MPDIPVGTQIFDIAFHPSDSIVFTGLLTGHIKAFSYDEQGKHEEKFSIRPSKRSCRALAISPDGNRLWAAGKAKTLNTIDVTRGELLQAWPKAHEAPINCLKRLTANLLASGDDDGVIKLWDPRKSDAIRSYTHHFDFISAFCYLDDARQLVSTSGDGTLSVIDVRAKKTEPLAQSEDQEDELLSVVAIKQGQKLVVGTQLGILSIFNRRNGWGDCVDRIPGHPHSIDTLCNLPSSYPSAQSTILTGSSDGMLRAVELFPTKLLGVVADHGEFPIECIAIDRDGEGHWVGSAGHEEVLKLTDLKEVFEDEDEDSDKDEDGSEGRSDAADGSDSESDELEDDKTGLSVSKPKAQGSDSENEKDEEFKEEEEEEDVKEAGEAETDDDDDENGSVRDLGEQDADTSDDDAVFTEKKRKRKKDKDLLQALKRPKARNELVTDRSFFADL
ncbi:WD repeat-containing protein JIP5 [Laetiporus sulphureus 93-53]|uniref:WD repeat-containing protein JIP5 n=1 Tax=Laetiporus sulphureus 93-53 TaxID=1314785 RepID=A0A165F1Q8_9APHY|nr:WD repeat-containing protein JIP5 [Laetiporus sulphureus 93-53]KZT08188.1 WD repeat-containing protein JIP5 [Laetiporus sulphureus 93-53]